jgi:hypothetical protein
MNMRELISKARWDAYRDGRHCAQRRKAFERDAAKVDKDFHWSARRMPSGAIILRLYFYLGGDVDKWDGFHPEECHDGHGHIAQVIERLTLEALRDVARATKDRLDGKSARP